MMRLWGIRHLRWFWRSLKVWRWAADCARMGIGLGEPNAADLIYLERIWDGEA